MAELVQFDEASGQLAALHKGQLRIRDLEAGTIKPIVVPAATKHLFFTSSDGLVLPNPRGVALVDPTAERVVERAFSHPHEGRIYSCSSDGKRLALIDAQGALSFWQLPGVSRIGEETYVGNLQFGSPFSFGAVMAFSPDSSLVALLNGDKLTWYSVEAGTPVGPRLPHLEGDPDDRSSRFARAIGMMPSRLLQFDPQGDLLASAGGTWTVQLWHVPKLVAPEKNFATVVEAWTGHRLTNEKTFESVDSERRLQINDQLFDHPWWTEYHAAKQRQYDQYHSWAALLAEQRRDWFAAHFHWLRVSDRKKSGESLARVSELERQDQEWRTAPLDDPIRELNRNNPQELDAVPGSDP